MHTTLFRYNGPLPDPGRFFASLESEKVHATSEVDELIVSKELVFPSLQTDVLARLPLVPT